MLVGEVVLGVGPTGYDLVVLVELVLIVRDVAPGMLLDPTGRDVGRAFAEVIVKVLAEQAGYVAATLLQPESDRARLVVLGAELLEASVRRRVAPHLMVNVKAGEDGSPRGATHRVADEGVLEGDTFFDDRGA